MRDEKEERKKQARSNKQGKYVFVISTNSHNYTTLHRAIYSEHMT